MCLKKNELIGSLRGKSDLTFNHMSHFLDVKTYFRDTWTSSSFSFVEKLCEQWDFLPIICHLSQPLKTLTLTKIATYVILDSVTLTRRAIKTIQEWDTPERILGCGCEAEALPLCRTETQTDCISGSGKQLRVDHPASPQDQLSTTDRSLLKLLLLLWEKITLWGQAGPPHQHCGSLCGSPDSDLTPWEFQGHLQGLIMGNLAVSERRVGVHNNRRTSWLADFIPVVPK